MQLKAVPEETYCLRTQAHAPTRVGVNLVCYRCGMLMGAFDGPELGSLLD